MLSDINTSFRRKIYDKSMSLQDGRTIGPEQLIERKPVNILKNHISATFQIPALVLDHVTRKMDRRVCTSKIDIRHRLTDILLSEATLVLQ